VVWCRNACRTAAREFRLSLLVGVKSPKRADGRTGKVDRLFFATTLGTPALEIKESSQATTRFKALYTDALVDCLIRSLRRNAKPTPSVSFVPGRCGVTSS